MATKTVCDSCESDVQQSEQYTATVFKASQPDVVRKYDLCTRCSAIVLGLLEGDLATSDGALRQGVL